MVGVAVLGSACGGDPDLVPPSPDAGVVDLGAPDLGSADIGAPDASPPPADAGARDAGIECNDYTFTYEAPGATEVWVTGSWVGWAGSLMGGAVPMVNNGAGTWTVTTRVEEGENAYKFIVDGTWTTDPNAPGYVDDGFGGQNGVFTTCSGMTRPVEACGDITEFDWRDTVMYFAMVDRFRDGDGQRDIVPGATDGDAYTGSSGQYEGGDLLGLTEGLAYLADLGVTALWLSAPFDNRDVPGDALNFIRDPNKYTGYHGYWPSPADIDWSDANGTRPRVEPRIGTADQLRSLVSAAHSSTAAVGGHGIKVLADYVMNHVDLESGLYRAHPDWFAATEEGRFRLCGPENLWDHPIWGTRCAFTDYLPPFDFDKPEVRTWSIEDASWWATEFDFDGFRLDAIKHVPEAWLTELRSALTQRITDAPDDRFYLVGETFNYGSRSVLKSFVDVETKLDGQFDFPMKDKLCQALFTKEESMEGFSIWMADNDGFYGERAIMTTWIGNHDIPRAIHFASGEITNCRMGSEPDNGWQSGVWVQPTDAAPYERVALAFAVLFTNPGIPLVYYGDELGLAGGGDPDNRRMMPWADDPLAPALLDPQVELRRQVRALARIRGENPVLGRGRRTTLSTTADTWVYRMSGCLGARDVVVALNRADQATQVSLPEWGYEDLVSGSSERGGTLDLPARGFRVFAVSR